ncbi:MAG: metallophosphoesterase family protein [Acidimicrobiales bacterium]|nr:metallophosphoesterase family protein [Acidimicrobiales bacterium]
MDVARRGPVGLFAVDDTSLQLTWRGLPGGDLTFEPLDDSGRAVGAAAKVRSDDDGLPGATVIEGLPPDTTGRVRVTFDGDPLAAVNFRTRPALPGAELVRLATISDLHLGATSFGHRGTILEDPGDLEPHPTRCARAAIADAVEWGATHLVAKGDLTNHGQVDEWRTWAGLVAGSPVPVDALPGNHDFEHPGTVHNLLPVDAAAAFDLSLALPLTVRDLPGTRLVLVDTTTGGENRGSLLPVLPDILDVLSETDQGVTVLLFIHHQLHDWYGQEGWPRGVSHRVALDLLERIADLHPRTLVSSGHTHRHRRWEHAGVTTTQVGSTKDYPGVWAGYTVHEGGVRQMVRRTARPDVMAWTDRTRRAAFGAWRFIGPGPLDSRCFEIAWPSA